MTRTRHVWTGLDATINIYQEDEDGDKGDLVLEYCFWEDFSITGILKQKRRPVTGRSRLKIVNGAWEYTVKIGCMYFRKDAEVDLVNVFSRQQALQIYILLDDPSYSGTFPLENDTHILKTVYGNNFTITGKEDDIIHASASFAAEEFDGDIT